MGKIVEVLTNVYLPNHETLAAKCPVWLGIRQKMKRNDMLFNSLSTKSVINTISLKNVIRIGISNVITDGRYQ